MATENLPVPAQQKPKPHQGEIGEKGVVLRNLDDLRWLAQTMFESKLMPSSMDSPAKIAIAIQTGYEAGLTPMMAVGGMAVIDGKPRWMGKTALALVSRSGVLERQPTGRYIGLHDPSKPGLDAFGDDYACEVTIHRKGNEPAQFTYSVGDAKLAGLWGKKTQSGRDTPWRSHPKDMLWWRALGRGLDRVCPDVLLGLALAEVARDYDTEERFDRARDVSPPRPSPAPASGAASDDPLLGKLEGGSRTPAPPEIVPQNATSEASPPASGASRVGEALEAARAQSGPQTGAGEARGKSPRSTRREPPIDLAEYQPPGDLPAEPLQPGLLDQPAEPACTHLYGDGSSALELQDDPAGGPEPVDVCGRCHQIVENPFD